MPTPLQSRCTHLCVYALIRCVICVISLLPVSWAMGFARLLGWLTYKLDKRHRTVAAENLRHAFPGYPEAWIDSKVRDSFAHLAVMAIETAILLRRMNSHNVNDYVRDHDAGDANFVWELLQKRPCIVMTGHVGNWEVLSLSQGLKGAKAAVIARNLDNPYLDRYVRRLRESTGLRIISKDGATEEAAQALSSGYTLGLVGDQDAGPKGLFVPYFGRPASTFKSIALLALEFQAPILVLGCVRNGDPLHHTIFLEDAILPEQYSNNPAAVKAITVRFTQALERIVGAYPEQYFWLHRRWKSQQQLRHRRAA